MSKARDLANLIASGNVLADGAVSVAEISDLTASAAELNKLDGVTASTAELNQVVGATSALQTQLDNISVTSGSLTKTFTQNETADITLSQGITSAPVVSATKEVPQTGVSTKGNWDVNSTASNYDFHNTAANVTLTPNTSTNTLTLGSGSFAATDVGKRIVGNGGDVVLTATSGTYDITGGSQFTDASTIAAGSWSMFGLKSAGDADGITMAGGSASSEAIFDIFGDGSAVSLHQLNNNFTDESGNYTATGNSAFNTSAKFGSHSYYTGTNSSDVFTIPYNQPHAAQWTASFWYKRADVGGNLSLNSRMVDFKEQSGVGTSITYESDNKWYFHLQSTNNGLGGKLIGNINDNQWHHIVVGSYFDSSSTSYFSKVYVDGVESTTNVSSYTRSASNPNAGIVFGGTYSYTNEMYFDQVRIFNRTLTQAEVTALGAELENSNTALGQYHVGVTNTSGRIDSSAFTDINGMTAAQAAATGTVNYAVSTDGRTTWSVAKGTDGVRPIVRNNSGTWQYNSESSTTTASNDISTSTLTDTVAFDTASYQTARNIRSFFNNDGTRLYIYGYNNEDLVSYALSTAYDISTKGTHLQSVNLGQSPYNLVNGFGPIWNNDGTKLYYPDHATVKELAVSTAYDLSAISSSASHTLTPSINGQLAGITWKPDGTRLYVVDDTSTLRVHTYTLTTAWDLSTASLATTHDGSSLWSHSGNRSTSIAWADSGSQLYVLDRNNDTVRRYNVSTAYDVGTATYSGTSNDIALGGSNDPCSITIDNNDGLLLVSDYGSQDTYEYTPTGTSVTAYNTTPTWANGSTNDELYTLQQALSVAANRMDKTQLDAIPDASHFPTGTSLDLMIALRMDTAAATLPTSDGVTLNYDAAALNEGAVLGTDYDFFFPSSTKVQIKSLAAQNLKVRVV